MFTNFLCRNVMFRLLSSRPKSFLFLSLGRVQIRQTIGQFLSCQPFEKHINKHILAHFTKNNLLHPNQSGFRENHSCRTALTSLVDQWLSSINDNKFCGALSVDLAKAFDVIDCDLLLRKLAVSQETLE